MGIHDHKKGGRELSPEEKQEHIAAEVAPYLKGGIQTAEDVRALMAAIWATVHNEGLPTERMLADLACLSGMAIAALSSYADSLEGRWPEAERKGFDRALKAVGSAAKKRGWPTIASVIVRDVRDKESARRKKEDGK